MVLSLFSVVYVAFVRTRVGLNYSIVVGYWWVLQCFGRVVVCIGCIVMVCAGF